MKKQFILCALIIFSALSAIAQQIPVGSCGIVYIHDAAGNRTKRIYFCNNNTDPYPTLVNLDTSGLPGISNSVFTKEEVKNMEFQEINALYPNPTSGQFSVTFNKSVANASITITDANGKKVQQVKATGNKVDFDLSAMASGIYFVRIEENGTVITKKVIKQ
jgi:Secretion system C-terminal sorting domain